MYKYIKINKSHDVITLDGNEILDHLQKNNLPHCHDNKSLVIINDKKISQYIRANKLKHYKLNLNQSNSRLEQFSKIIRDLWTHINYIRINSKTRKANDYNIRPFWLHKSILDYWLDHHRKDIYKKEQTYYNNIYDSHFKEIDTLANKLFQFFNLKYKIKSSAYNSIPYSWNALADVRDVTNYHINIKINNINTTLIKIDKYRNIYNYNMLLTYISSIQSIQAIIGPNISREMMHFIKNEAKEFNTKLDDRRAIPMLEELEAEINKMVTETAYLKVLHNV